MVVVITSMESLPDHCFECPCHDGESGYCQADASHRYSDYRPFWCPLKEIVRCKDCKWYKEGYDIDGKFFTRCNGDVRVYGHTKPDWFCADGERRC